MTDNSGFSDNLQKIKEDYLKSLPEKLQSMTNLIEGLKKEANQTALSELRNHVHQLAGNAGTFGYQQATDLCKGWDVRLKEIMDNFSNEKVQSILGELDAFMQQLKQCFQLS